MSAELYLVTDRTASRLHLSEQLPFGGKVICAVLWQICIPAAKGHVDGGNTLWARWYEDFRQRMGGDLEQFLGTISASAMHEDVPPKANFVPINEFYAEMTNCYQVLTDLSFRRQHPVATLELVPDVMAALNILESEIVAGAKLVAMGAE